MLDTMRRLHARGRACRGVAVDADGAMLGPDCILVGRTPSGFRTLTSDDAAAIQKAILDPECEPGWLIDQARRIADALAKGEIALAQIYGLYIPIDDLDDATLRRLAARRLVKANFDPSQPRVPAGNPDGGQWTDAGGSAMPPHSDNGSASEGDGFGDGGWPAEAGDDELDADDFGGDPGPDDGFEGPSNRSPPPPEAGGDEPPRIPSRAPGSAKEGNSIARSVAEWLRRADVLGLTEATWTLWEILRITAWLTAEQLAAILSYQDAPRTLEELQDAVLSPRPGYQVHHIVEYHRRSTSELSNWNRFGNRLNARENLVRIPLWKHVQISTWYSSRNADFGGLTPREYLRGKSWREQYEVGLQVLRLFGVLR